MPELISNPTRVPVPGGKVIDEYVGRASTGSQNLSVAHMVAPSGWSEPAQTPEFSEVTVVLRGTLLVDCTAADGTPARLSVEAGQAVRAGAGERVRYSTETEETEYVAVCLPAFGPDLAHRDSEDAQGIADD